MSRKAGGRLPLFPPGLQLLVGGFIARVDVLTTRVHGPSIRVYENSPFHLQNRGWSIMFLAKLTVCLASPLVKCFRRLRVTDDQGAIYKISYDNLTIILR